MGIAYAPEGVSPRLVTEVYNTIKAIEAKIREEYPEVETELLCGPDEALHLIVYTNDPSLWNPMEYIEDELVALEDRENLSLYVVPLRFSDREVRSEDNPPPFTTNGTR